MLRTTTLLKVLPLSLLVVLSVSQAGSVLAGTNSWTSNGPQCIRVCSLAIDPVAPGTLYVGPCGAGVYKSTNGGASWTPAVNGLTDPNVSDLAIDPVTPTILYAGTSSGGVFRSTNGGEIDTP